MIKRSFWSTTWDKVRVGHVMDERLKPDTSDLWDGARMEDSDAGVHAHPEPQAHRVAGRVSMRGKQKEAK
jgi:hypothetical protein